jgi:hypothetical protein
VHEKQSSAKVDDVGGVLAIRNLEEGFEWIPSGFMRENYVTYCSGSTKK